MQKEFFGGSKEGERKFSHSLRLAFLCSANFDFCHLLEIFFYLLLCMKTFQAAIWCCLSNSRLSSSWIKWGIKGQRSFNRSDLIFISINFLKQIKLFFKFLALTVSQFSSPTSINLFNRLCWCFPDCFAIDTEKIHRINQNNSHKHFLPELKQWRCL